MFIRTPFSLQLNMMNVDYKLIIYQVLVLISQEFHSHCPKL